VLVLNLLLDWSSGYWMEDAGILEIVDQPFAVLFDEDVGEGAFALAVWGDVVDLEDAVGDGDTVAEEAELLDVDSHGTLQEIRRGNVPEAGADFVAALPPVAFVVDVVSVRGEE